jgi:hypothetical protein
MRCASLHALRKARKDSDLSLPPSLSLAQVTAVIYDNDSLLGLAGNECALQSRFWRPFRPTADRSLPRLVPQAPTRSAAPLRFHPAFRRRKDRPALKRGRWGYSPSSIRNTGMGGDDLRIGSGGMKNGTRKKIAIRYSLTCWRAATPTKVA